MQLTVIDPSLMRVWESASAPVTSERAVLDARRKELSSKDREEEKLALVSSLHGPGADARSLPFYILFLSWNSFVICFSGSQRESAIRFYQSGNGADDERWDDVVHDK